MLRLDELEVLSRFAAGELPPPEAEQMKADLQRRPELARALEQLSSLDIAVETLPETLGREEVEALVRRVPRPGQSVFKPRLRIAAAVALGLVAVSAALLFGLGRETLPHLVALSGSVTLDGVAVASPSEALPLPPGTVVRCGSGSASIIETRQARVLLARDSELTVSPDLPAAFTLEKGTLAAMGRDIRLTAGGSRIELVGRGVLSWEPEDDLVRATDAMEANKTPQLGFQWLRLPLAATAAVAAGGVTLLVLEGRAKVTANAAPPVEVAAGQKWSSRNPSPSAIASSGALTPSAAVVRAQPEQRLPGEVADPGPADLGTFSRDQLIAEAKRLRSENSTLAARNQEIQKKLEDSDPKAQARKENYYRPDPDELRALAERGEMRLHPPPSVGGHSLYDSRVARELGLQPDEEAKIRDIYNRSAQRIHDGLVSLYVEIGGDANVGNSLETMGVLQELQSKTPRRDREAAFQAAIRERAGLERPTNVSEASALLRAYRLFYREEERIFAELDALLGPARAEQFLNHPNTSHSTWSTNSRQR